MDDNRIGFPYTWSTIRGIIGNIKYIPRMFKYYYQRARYGISEYDSWNLDAYIAKVLIRGCIELKTGFSHPYCFSPEEWSEELDELAKEFEWYLEDHYVSAEEMEKRYNIMFDRFKEVFRDLWD